MSPPETAEIYIGEGLPRPLLPPRQGRSVAAVITQAPTTQRAKEVAAVIGEEGCATEIIGVPDRDEAKTLEVAGSVYESLGQIGLSRDDTIVGVGGGSVTDLAGFVAGTWLRGVEVVHVPTTLLAAIDAAIGGKTAINVGGKNQVGVFWNPTRVIVDMTILRELPIALTREGMAEALKTGLVGDPGLVTLLTDLGVETPLEEILQRAIAAKTRFVSSDPLDRSERAFLNFGHTIGHAVEYASQLSHGESVAVGMVAAARISAEVAGFEEEGSVTAAVRKLGLPTEVRGLDRSHVESLIRRDKKRDRDEVRMVLLRRVADPILTAVGPREIGLGLDVIGI